MNAVWIALKAGELEQAIELYEQSLLVIGDIGDRHGVAAVSMGLGMAAHFRGECEKVQPLLTEAQTNFREGVGGQGLSWPLSNVLVDTHTHDLLLQATRRYESSLNLPPDDWGRMVIAEARPSEGESGLNFREQERSGYAQEF